MKSTTTIFHVILTFFLVFSPGIYNSVFAQACDASTPSFTFDLTGNPDSIWVSSSVSRSGICCGLDPTANPPIRCIEFFFTLDPEAQGIRFDLASGAIPPGALGYQINCGPVIPVGEMICLDGVGPHRLTFCKPGNNQNTYSITSVKKPDVSDPQVVSDACRGIMTATGYELSSIQWTSVPFNATYNSYLSCTSGCSTTTVTYQIGAPPFIDYEVSGFPVGGCSITRVTNITRVYFVTDINVIIQPDNPVVCFGGTNTTITANGVGGAPPYRYLWSTGQTTASIDVGVGTYWVQVADSTNCPRAADTVTVTAFLSPITANAGPDVESCVNNPSVAINGSVNLATGGIWSGGGGAYAPSNTSLNTVYTPTAAEITAGTVTHTLTTTGNSGCPAASDVVVQRIVPSPVVNAGLDRTVCANNVSLTLAGSVTNATGGTWSGGGGTFSPDATSLNAMYTPSATEISNGTVTLTLTSTGNGSCLPVTDQMVITITPSPTVNAGVDFSICANNATATLAGLVTIATGGVWSGGNGTFSPNANTLNATYTPSLTEISNGSVALTLTSTGNGLCLPVTDQVLITITPAPVVNAGLDRTVCANNSTFALNGTVSVQATGGIWTGGGAFNPGATTLNANYTPSAAEISSGTALLTLTSTGNGNCNPVSDQMVVTITPAPTINAGSDRTVCANNATLTLGATVNIATGVSWSGGGTFSPNNTSITVSYTPSAAEILAGTATLTAVSTGNGTCNPVSDQLILTITPAPVVSAGPDVSVCANNSRAVLNGTVSAAATGGIWSGGSGIFSPNATSTTTNYFPTATEITNGNLTLTLTSTGNGNCNPVSDQMLLTITPAPTINVGPDLTICANNAVTPLTAAITVATGVQWTGGSGTYAPDQTSTSINYTPSASEISLGSVILTATTTGNANCLALSDQVRLTITPAPTVSAGASQTVCDNSTSIALNGIVTISGGGVWSSTGTGSFSPDNTTLNASYSPSPADTLAGSVILRLTSTNNGNCLAVWDTMTITFSQTPQVDAGANQTTCTNNFPIQLNATGTPGVWSGGAGTFSPSVSAMNATYTPTAAEVGMGTITLTFTTTLNGACTPVSDMVTITIPPGPTADAGSDFSVCADTAGFALNGVITVAPGGIWTHNGSGSFDPDNVTLNATYIPSATDISNGSVIFTLTSTGYISCNPPAIDQMEVTITPAPTINAGPDLTVCADTNGVAINGVTTVATGGAWSTLGSGSFFPQADTLNSTYILSNADTAAHAVRLVITSTGNGMCKAVTDTLDLTVTPVPIVNAGSDQTVCSDSLRATLNGSVYNAAGGMWSTTGTGTFSPNEFSLNAFYYPSAADRTAGVVNIFLTSTGNGNCRAVSGSSLLLSIFPAPTANAGIDRTVCGNAANITLNGTLTVATTGRWSTSGTGTFVPNDSTLNATYVPSATDITSGTTTLTLTTTGNNCVNTSDNMVALYTPGPVVNAGADRTVCANNASLVLNGTVSIASGGGWSGGAGIFSPDTSDLNAGYIPTATEISNGIVRLILTSTGNGLCNPVSDTMTIVITPAPTVSAGPDQIICMDQSSIVLPGAVTVATGVLWSGNGTGSFSPGTNSMTPTYFASATDKTNGSVTIVATSNGNGNCIAVRDTMILSFSLPPTVNAGPASTCAGTGVQLNGSVTVATTGIWTSSGSGTFTPSNNVLNAVYTPSVADNTAGSVLLTLTATTCTSVSDAITLFVIAPPDAIVGNDQTVCANNGLTALSGTVNNATGGVWTSSGGGTFSPSSTNLSINYTPSAADIVNGFANIILSTTGNGNCLGDADTIRLTITPAPTVTAGPDQLVCADTSGISLNGMITVSGGGVWSSNGSGTFSPDTTTMNAVYIPSATDISTGNVTLTLVSTNNGQCLAVSDAVTMTISPAPTIDAGGDLTACEDVNDVAFLGTVTVATGGLWTSDGSGSFSNAALLHTVYSLTPADRLDGQVSLVLTSTGNGMCKAVRDTVLLNVTRLPFSNAGSDQTVCNDNTGVQLGGIITGASGGTWTTSGSGLFTANNTQLNALYVPSAADTTAGSTRLFLTTNVIGGCAVIDSMDITYIDPLLNLPDHYCFEVNLLIDANPVSTPAGTTFQWYQDNVVIPSETNSTLTVTQRGIYSISLTYDQCTVFDSTNITLPEELVSTNKLICEGASTQLSTSVITNGSYVWMHGGNTVGTNSNVLNATDDNDSTYTVTVTDSLGCIERDTLYLTTIPVPILTLSNVPSCQGLSVTLNATPSNVTDTINSTYTWALNGVPLNFTTPVITVQQTGIYSAVYTLGECTATDASEVNFYPLPIPNNESAKNFCLERDGSVVLDAGTGVRYLWLTGGDTTRYKTVSAVGYYAVEIFNEYNCSVIDSIEARNLCPPRVFVPTVFTPNGDGTNDMFNISGAHFKNFELTIFSRWGEIIFHTNDRNNVWDGNYKDAPIPVGVYAWIIRYEGDSDEYQGPFVMEGSITVNR